MRIFPLLLLAAAAPLAAEGPVSLRVGIEAPADTGYEIRTQDGRKLGRTGPYEGFAPEEVVEVSGQGTSSVSLAFYDDQGLVAACAPVKVRFQDAQPLCQPQFSLTASPRDRSACESDCRPTPLLRKRKMERGWFTGTPGY